MSIIDTKIKPFTAEAFKDGKFVTVSDAEIDSKWAVFFFYPADFTFVCPTELEDLAGQYSSLQSMGVEVFSCLLYTSPSPRDATLSRMPSSA